MSLLGTTKKTILLVITIVSFCSCLERRVDDDKDSDSNEAAGCGICHGVYGSGPSHLVHNAMEPSFGATMECEACHDLGAEWLESGHMNGVVDVDFPEGSLARANGADPVWNGTTCEGVHCHGGSSSGGNRPSPEWNDENAMVCGDCHGLPPTEGHVSTTDCQMCHSGSYDENGELNENHLDGNVTMSGSN